MIANTNHKKEAVQKKKTNTSSPSTFWLCVHAVSMVLKVYLQTNINTQKKYTTCLCKEKGWQKLDYNSLIRKEMNYIQLQ